MNLTLPNCHSCLWSGARSERPDVEFNYECCFLGILPIEPSLPIGDHDCRSYEPGLTKLAIGMGVIWGDDIEL